MQPDTTCAADGEGLPHRCSREEVSKRSIISSKHSSGLHLWFFHRPDNIPDDASRMTIATSGTHLSGQHRWGWSQCGWAAWGRGERSQRSKPSINFDTSHRLFLSHRATLSYPSLHFKRGTQATINFNHTLNFTIHCFDHIYKNRIKTKNL